MKYIRRVKRMGVSRLLLVRGRWIWRIQIPRLSVALLGGYGAYDRQL